MKCEIQVRTILMDAWASVSHHLEYKQQIDLPRELFTTFNSLAGLFYVADTTFESFRKGVEEARAKLMETVQQDEFDLGQIINLDSLTAYLKWRFPKRKIETVESDIVSELRRFGYKNIHQLDNKVTIALPFLESLEKEEFHDTKWKVHWAPSGLVRACLDLADDRYYQFRTSMFPPKLAELYIKYRQKLKPK